MADAEVIIDAVRDQRYQQRELTDIRGLMVHRVGVNMRTGVVLGYEAVEICDAFTGRVPRWYDVAAVTGRQNPYTFYVGGDRGNTELDGKVWQALELEEIGHHARRYSRSFVGIGLIGDFRLVPPGEQQYHEAVRLCADLCLMLGLTPSSVVGHGEIKGAHGGEKAPGKAAACPGDFLDMSALRSSVASLMTDHVRHDASIRMRDRGFRV